MAFTIDNMDHKLSIFIRTFHVLSRTPEGEHVAMTVHEKRDAGEAMRAIESSGMFPVSIESSHESAKLKATALNAANGFVVQGCSNC